MERISLAESLQSNQQSSSVADLATTMLIASDALSSTPSSPRKKGYAETVPDFSDLMTTDEDGGERKSFLPDDRSSPSMMTPDPLAEVIDRIDLLSMNDHASSAVSDAPNDFWKAILQTSSSQSSWPVPFANDQALWRSAMMLNAGQKDQDFGLADLYQSQLDRNDISMIKSILQDMRDHPACNCQSKRFVDQSTQVDEELNPPEEGHPEGEAVLAVRHEAPLVVAPADLGLGGNLIQIYADDPTEDQFPLRGQTMISVAKRHPDAMVGRKKAAAFFRDAPTTQTRMAVVLVVGRSPVRINLTLDWRSVQPIVLEAGVNVLTWARSVLHVNEQGLYALNPAPGRRIGTGLTMQMVSRHMIRPMNGMPSDDILDYAYAPGRLPHRISIVTPLDWEPEEDRAFTSLVTSLYDKQWPPYGLVHIFDVSCNKWDIERVNYATSYELPVIRRTFSPEF